MKRIFLFIVTNWYSRRREFRADRGGADLAGTGSMIGALEMLKHRPGRTDAAADAGVRYQYGRNRRLSAFVYEPPALGSANRGIALAERSMIARIHAAPA